MYRRELEGKITPLMFLPVNAQISDEHVIGGDFKYIGELPSIEIESLATDIEGHVKKSRRSYIFQVDDGTDKIDVVVMPKMVDTAKSKDGGVVIMKGFIKYYPETGRPYFLPYSLEGVEIP